MFYGLLLLLFGVVCTVVGGQMCWIALDTSLEATEARLQEIEANQVPKNRHLAIGEHYACYPATLVHYKRSKYSAKEPTKSTKVDYYYYPIVSRDHQFAVSYRAWRKSIRESKKSDEPLNEPVLENFRVLVKSERFSTFGEIPGDLRLAKGVQGVVITPIESLPDGDADLIHTQFPGFDSKNVLIIEEGRDADPIKPFAVLGTGLLMCVAGIYIFYKERKTAQARERERSGQHM